MLLDKLTTFSDQQTIAAVASTIASTYSVDVGAAGTDNMGNTPIQDIGRTPVDLLVQVTETVTSAGAATVTFQLIHSDNADLSSPTILATTPAIALATLVAGYQARLGMAPGVTKRYIGVQYVIGTATTTAGKVTAGLLAPYGKSTTFIG